MIFTPICYLILGFFACILVAVYAYLIYIVVCIFKENYTKKKNKQEDFNNGTGY